MSNESKDNSFYCVSVCSSAGLLLGDDIILSEGIGEVYYAFKCSQFEFYAEDESGNGIVVTDGYCRR